MAKENFRGIKLIKMVMLTSLVDLVSKYGR